MKWLLPIFFCLILHAPAEAGRYACQPTPEDEMGPFYRPGAPLRNSVGKGYVTYGKVLSAANCAPIPRARIEFWLTDNHGRYDPGRRASWYSDADGRYQFESNLPSLYTGRPPHIHIRVSAPGFNTLVTQHYPQHGKTQGQFDLVLRPE